MEGSLFQVYYCAFGQHGEVRLAVGERSIEKSLLLASRARFLGQERIPPDRWFPHTLSADRATIRYHDPSSDPLALNPAKLQLILDAFLVGNLRHCAVSRYEALLCLVLWGMRCQPEAIADRWEAIDNDTRWICGKGRTNHQVSFLALFVNCLHPLSTRCKRKEAISLFVLEGTHQYENGGVRTVLARDESAAGITHLMPIHMRWHLLFTWLKEERLERMVIQAFFRLRLAPVFGSHLHADGGRGRVFV